MLIAFVSGNSAATIDSGQQDQFEFTVGTSEDFGDAPASYDPTQAAVAGLEDLAHAALAEPLDQDIGTQEKLLAASLE